jgi:hypothetical protein
MADKTPKPRAWIRELAQQPGWWCMGTEAVEDQCVKSWNCEACGAPMSTAFYVVYEPRCLTAAVCCMCVAGLRVKDATTP